jgi:hypothetical protein
MTTIRNRRGSVLLMAIGMLAIVAILASTFLIVSNLDVLETQTLSVKAQADPVAQGVLTEVMAAIADDRHVGATSGPYGATSAALCDYMEYADNAQDNKTTMDRWLAREYDWREKIGLQVSRIDTDPCEGKGYRWDGTFSKFNVKPTDGTGTIKDGDYRYVDTDADGYPDARLYDTKVLCPGATSAQDADYYAAVRVVDLSGRICVNTAGGGNLSIGSPVNTVPIVAGYKPLPLAPAPAAIDLYSYVGPQAFKALHDASGLTKPPTPAPQGRCGGITAAGEKTMQSYDRYAARVLLTAGKPPGSSATTGFCPFSSGDEMFLLMCNPYVTGSPRYAGRLYDLLSAFSSPILKSLHATDEGYIYSSSVGGGEPTDEVRRHLTTFSSVGACVRHAQDSDALDPEGFKFLRSFSFVNSQAACMSVYRRMNRMLTELNIGKASGSLSALEIRKKMAAHFAANLWAYQSNPLNNVVTAGASPTLNGAPWRFKPDDANFAVYGARQELVITQVYAKHRKTTSDTDAQKNWAFAIAVEIANPSPYTADLSQYRLVYNGVDANAISMSGTLLPTTTGTILANKKVIYTFDMGPAATDTPASFFGVATTGWIPDPRDAAGSKFPWLAKGNGRTIPYIELRHVYGTDQVTVDRADATELAYDLPDSSTSFKTMGGSAASPVVKYIRRDDRTKHSTTGQRLALYNLALYYTVPSPTTADKMGISTGCAVTDGLIKQDNVTTVYSPGIYRPREPVDLTTLTPDPNATDPYRMTSLGELANIYLAGPLLPDSITTSSRRVGFPQRILLKDTSNIFKDLGTRGRLPIRAGTQAAGAIVLNSDLNDSYDGTPWKLTLPYPDVPAGAVFGEFFSRLYPHYARPNQEAPRMYGLINVNTATKDVFMRLPWPAEAGASNKLGLRTYLGAATGLLYSREDAVDFILAYRDKRALQPTLAATVGTYVDYTNRAGGIVAPVAVGGSVGTKVGMPVIANLRSDANSGSTCRGFVTPGEVAIPLGDYMEYLMTKTPFPNGISSADAVRKDPDFARARNSLFSGTASYLPTVAIADCITTRSDVFGVYIHVQLDAPIPARYKWRYLAIVDRSCVLGPKDFPAVLMFSEVK